MSRNRILVAACVWALALCATSRAQTADPPRPEPYVAQKPFFKRLFTWEAVGATLPGAVVQQARDWPTEWGGKRVGFEKRAASLYGQFAVGLLIEDGVRALHPEDSRYRRLGKGNFFLRTANVITGTVLARKPDGGRTVALALPANAYGSWAIATLWSPREYRTAGSIFHWGTAGLAVTPAVNFIKEFWPDVKAVFRKKPAAPSTAVGETTAMEHHGVVRQGFRFGD
jgi:hypothetical protein